MGCQKKCKLSKSFCVWCFGGLVAFLICVAWFLTPLLTPSIMYSFFPDMKDVDASAARGQFGDMFGSINALFSGWAFVGVCIAVFLQKQQLDETRKELDRQHLALKQQRFESTFFSMLSLHNDILNSIILSNKEVGRGAIKLAHDQLLNNSIDMDGNSNAVAKKRNLVKALQQNFSHYFRSMHTIFEIIYNSEMEDKQFYANIVLAQMSHDELVVLYCNCYFHETGQKFQKYADEYDVFNNFPQKEHFEKLRKAASEEQASQ